jgi:hypothetical protein
MLLSACSGAREPDADAGKEVVGAGLEREKHL